MDRFRVTARKFIYFQARSAKLGPSYINCDERQSHCTRQKAQPRKGCPDCEFTIQHKIFVKELDAELAKIKRGTRIGARKWPRDLLLRTVIEIGSLAEGTKGMSPKWSVFVAILVSTYRSEKGKKGTIDNHNLMASVSSGPPVVDVGDFD